MRWKPWLLLIVLAALSAGVLTFFAPSLLHTGSPAAAPPPAGSDVKARKADQPSITFIDPSKGDPGGSKLIVEYGDYICPPCRTSNDAVIQLLAAHPKGVKFVWKSLPNPSYPGADLAAEATLCAGNQGKFWEYHDALFGESGTPTEASLGLVAANTGLDTQAFNTCLTDHDMRPAVERTVSEAVALGVDATPYFFIDGKRYSGSLTYAQLEAAIK